MAAEAAQPGAQLPASQPPGGGDSRLAAILQKQAAGEKLSASERGYLGGIKRKGASKKVAPEVNPNPLLPPPANPDNPLFDGAAEDEAPAGVPAAPAVDSTLLRRTADALLTSLDSITKLCIVQGVKAAGGDKQTQDEYKAAVALQPENRTLIVENSEPAILKLCEWFECAPAELEKILKNSGLVGGLLAHSLGVYTAVKQIRESRKEWEKEKETKNE